MTDQDPWNVIESARQECPVCDHSMETLKAEVHITRCTRTLRWSMKHNQPYAPFYASAMLSPLVGSPAVIDCVFCIHCGTLWNTAEAFRDDWGLKCRLLDTGISMDAERVPRGFWAPFVEAWNEQHEEQRTKAALRNVLYRLRKKRKECIR